MPVALATIFVWSTSMLNEYPTHDVGETCSRMSNFRVNHTILYYRCIYIEKRQITTTESTAGGQITCTVYTSKACHFRMIRSEGYTTSRDDCSDSHLLLVEIDRQKKAFAGVTIF